MGCRCSGPDLAHGGLSEYSEQTGSGRGAIRHAGARKPCPVSAYVWFDYARRAGSSNVPASVGSKGSTPTTAFTFSGPYMCG